jgi:hypothetical protein
VPTLPPPARQGGRHARRGETVSRGIQRFFLLDRKKQQGKSRFALCCWTISLDGDEVLIWWAHLQEYYKYPSIVIVIYSLQPYTYLVVQPGDDTLDNGSSAAGDIHVQAVYWLMCSAPLIATFVQHGGTTPIPSTWCYTSVLISKTVVLHHSPLRTEILQNLLLWLYVSGLAVLYHSLLRKTILHHSLLITVMMHHSLLRKVVLHHSLMCVQWWYSTTAGGTAPLTASHSGIAPFTAMFVFTAVMQHSLPRIAVLHSLLRTAVLHDLLLLRVILHHLLLRTMVLHYSLLCLYYGTTPFTDAMLHHTPRTAHC